MQLLDFFISSTSVAVIAMKKIMSCIPDIKHNPYHTISTYAELEI